MKFGTNGQQLIDEKNAAGEKSPDQQPSAKVKFVAHMESIVKFTE